MAPQAFAGHSRRVRPRAVGTREGAGLREAERGSVAVGCRPRGSDSGPALHPWVGTSGGASSSGSHLGCRCVPGSGPGSQGAGGGSSIYAKRVCSSAKCQTPPALVY